MRGKENMKQMCNFFSRITPAYAGKREVKPDWEAAEQDHPRLCGEKQLSEKFRSFKPGSPPPMRGKAHKSSGTAFLIRITPAYAGKSSQRICERIETKDHPRLCGEKG